MERQGLDMQSKSNNGYTILVSGASGIVGYGILRSLRELNCKLIGATIYEESPAACFSDVVVQPPMSVDNRYIPWLLDTISDYNIDMIIPSIEIDVSLWNKNRKQLESTRTHVLLNSFNLIEMCSDKWCFYQNLEKCGLKYNIESSIVPDFKRFSLPFILKPRRGYGSKGIVKITSEEEFNLYRGDIGPVLMMQEYIGSEEEEYTVSAFFDKDSQMRACMAMKRKLSQHGYTESAEVVAEKEFSEVIRELSLILKPVGPTNFQFRKHNNNWKLLEINPRISSATSIRKAFGYNESAMCVEYFLEHKKIEQPIIRNGKAIRYTEECVFYDSNNI